MKYCCCVKVSDFVPSMHYRRSDNIEGLRPALQSLLERISKHEIIIKSADKGDITVIMSVDFYRRMCYNELSNENFYKIIGERDPSQRVLKTVKEFARKYETILTNKEIQFLTERNYRMTNFYMLPKLHKSKYIIQFQFQFSSANINNSPLGT